MEELKEIIETFDSLIVCQVEIQGDVLYSPLNYVSGNFSCSGLPNYQNFREIIENIDATGEICEYIGYSAYSHRLKNSFYTCAEIGTPSSIMLQLNNNQTRVNYLLSIKKHGSYINLLFTRMDKTTELDDFDSILASSYKDRLTNLFNFSTMKMHLNRHQGGGYLCLFDLNGFKSINDTFGHAVGDDILVFVSSFLISISSQDEIFYRRSGDEFMILFFNPSLDYALGVIEKIEKYLESISTTALKHCEGLKCSAAFGIVELGNNNDYRIQDNDCIKLADLAMYQAKKAKKNYHFISYEDSKTIISSGLIDARLKELINAVDKK